MKEEAVYYMYTNELGKTLIRATSELTIVHINNNTKRVLIDLQPLSDNMHEAIIKPENKCESHKFYEAYQYALNVLGLTTIGREEPQYQLVVTRDVEICPTLRDEFAGKAMQGILAAQTEKRANGSPLYEDEVHYLSKEAYQMADAMLKAREQ